MEPLAQQPQIALPDVPGIGEVIADKYRVEEILGVGGMGVVLAARHLQLGQLVAIKVLSATGEHREDAIERFLREGRAAAALTSDHVVRIYDVGLLPTGIPFMVMERLRGQDLAFVLKERGPMGIAEAVEFVAQATGAIAEAHDVGVVHRDLKPSNLFLTRRSDGTACVKVLDFGISKQLSDLETATMQTALTSTRQVMGSPAYMSPEQVRDARSVDHRTDVWALGVTLYELLTQRPAFDADTLPAVCAAIAADPPVPLRERRADIPEALERIVLRCLEKQPAKRYATARALLEALREFQGVVIEPKATPSERNAPTTQMSPSNSAGSKALRSGEVARLEESGSRRVIASGSVPSDGTLVSARTPPSGEQWAAGAEGEASRPGSMSHGRRRLHAAIVPSLVILVGVGAVTAWYWRSRSNPVEGGTNASHTTAHFVLRIESSPSQASVIESGSLIGVTPLAIPMDHAMLQRAARQFQVHKDGFLDITIQQADSPTDVQQTIVLTPLGSPTDVNEKSASTQPPTLSQHPTLPSPKPSVVKAKPPPQRPSASPEPEAPGIRGTR